MRSLPLALGLAAAAPAEAQQLAYADVAEAGVASAGAGAGDSPAAAPTWLRYALLDRFEWNVASGEDGFGWDFSTLVGGEKNRVYLATSGEGGASGRLDYAELDALYSRYLGGDIDLNLGIRYDIRPRPSRAYAALGGQYDDGKLWLGAWAYFSHRGEASARLAGYYNLPVTGPLVLQPSFELDANAADVPELGLGRGLSYAELGLRLRYRLGKHFAPYLGVSWSRDLGRTARLTRAAGDDPEAKSVVAGLNAYWGD
ncbi:MAG: copper resistance protein B [Alphaproteobacteria bacterium]|nr:copper resistance protein B [Alphaproteobacteria bacterium]MBV9372966.1 copper resistance protein B [Alphaproteobacteria bacterium]MBV9901333.1 copper resistance protein B [Alphaproteobacteria bacterium]